MTTLVIFLLWMLIMWNLRLITLSVFYCYLSVEDFVVLEMDSWHKG